MESLALLYTAVPVQVQFAVCSKTHTYISLRVIKKGIRLEGDSLREKIKLRIKLKKLFSDFKI